MIMVVITLTNCPQKLRGDITKWLCEISTGVYVGQLSARVRDALWSRICENIKNGQATMVYSYANEQHFEFRVHNTSWKVRDFDGIKLMLHPNTTDNANELRAGFSKASKRLAGIRKQSTSGKKNPGLVFIDIETTGLDTLADEIIEIAAISVNANEEPEPWSTLVKIGKPIPVEITKLTQITDEMLEGGVEIQEALKQLSEIIKGKTVVCYNRKFDMLFLRNAYSKADIEFPVGKAIDLLMTARKKVSGITNYKLGTLAEYYGIPFENQHRAMADAEILYKVFLKLNEK